MLLAGNTFYDLEKFTPTYYVAMMELERYFAREVLKNEGTRIFYGATNFAFRRRLDLLAKDQTLNISDFQFPFACYTRTTNFELDPRLGINSAIAYGGTNVGMDVQLPNDIVIPNCRFIQVVNPYTMTFFFNTDADMQIAHEILLWVKHLAPKQWTTNSLEYADARVDIPIVLEILSINTDQTNYNEAEWLESQKIFPIEVQFVIKTHIFDQVAQGATSTLFKTAEQSVGPALYIAKEVLFDFLTYKGEDQFLDEENIELSVSATFNPDPEATITVTTDNITENSARLNWNILLQNADPGYVETAHIILSTDPENVIDVDATLGQYNLTDLSPATDYSVKIMFETIVDTYVTKYATFTTGGTAPEPKGIIGLKF